MAMLNFYSASRWCGPYFATSMVSSPYDILLLLSPLRISLVSRIVLGELGPAWMFAPLQFVVFEMLPLCSTDFEYDLIRLSLCILSGSASNG